MKNLLLCLSFFMPFALSAQISIEASDLPLIGDEFETTVDGLVSDLDVGTPGGNQVWDFTGLALNGLNLTAFVGTELFFDNEGDFPGADMVQVTGTQASFLNVTDDMMYDMGLALQLFNQPFLTSVPYVPPVPVRALPTTMGTTFSAAFSFEVVLADETLAADSIRLKHEESRVSEIDAWGTVSTLSGTFDALREELITTTLDSVWVYMNGVETLSSVNEVERVRYNWLAKEVGIPIVSVLLDEDTGLPEWARWWVADFVSPPVPVYSYTYGGSGLLQFTDLSANNPDSWLWEFGDGSTSTDQNPLHQYAAPGEYELCLTVENEFGAATSCQFIYVFFSPSADFSVEALGGGIYAFTDMTADSVLLWSWDFGDGNTSIEPSPEHLYTASGTYTVCLTTTNPAGSDTFCMDVEVMALPVAGFTYENIGDMQLAFTDVSTNSPDSWFWDFGDGATSTEQNPEHAYVVSGMYVVCLTASNAAGSAVYCDSTVQVWATSTRELPLEQALSVYPNPIGEEVHFRLNGVEEMSGLSLKVTDARGHVVYRAPFGKSDLVDTHSWPASLYLYSVLSSSGKLLAAGCLVKLE